MDGVGLDVHGVVALLMAIVTSLALGTTLTFTGAADLVARAVSDAADPIHVMCQTSVCSRAARHLETSWP